MLVNSVVFFAILLSYVNSRICPGKKESFVEVLPSFDINTLPCMYSGFIKVEKDSNSEIFYWLTLAPETHTEKPLLISLSGGAGKSGLFSMFTVNGPLQLNTNGNNKVVEDGSWSKLANLLYIDFPVGTGYSLATNLKDIPTNEKELNEQFYKFLQAFYKDFKAFFNNDIYIIGDNFSGKYVPALAKYILEHNEKIKKQEVLGEILNLKRIGLGNSLLDTSYQLPARKHLAKGLGLMSEFDDENQFDFLVQKCDASGIKKSDKAHEDCRRVLGYLQDLGGDIFEFDVRRTMNKDDKIINTLSSYLNQEKVKKAIHTQSKTWVLRNQTVSQALSTLYSSYSSVPSLEHLLNSSFPIYIYSGQFDLSFGPSGLLNLLNNINWQKSDDFKNAPRKLWYVDRNGYPELAGNVKLSDNLTFVTVRNAGQFTTRDNARASLDLISKFLSKEEQSKVWLCNSDSDCSLTVKKCAVMKYCSGNGECSDKSGGRCVCNEGFYGSDCSIKIANLTTGHVSLLPKDLQVFKVVNYVDNILLEIDSDDKNIEVSLLDKKEKDHLFNPEKHAVTYKLVTHKLILYIEKELLDNCVIVIRNLELLHEIKLKIYINYYNFQKYSFWGPGGFGFFIGIFSFALGLAFFVSACYIYKRYKQDKSFQLLLDLNRTGNVNNFNLGSSSDSRRGLYN